MKVKIIYVTIYLAVMFRLEGFQVFVLTPTHKTRVIHDLSSETAVDELFQLIAAKIDREQNSFWLLYGGRILVSGNSLQAYNIQNLSTIVLYDRFLKLRE